MDILIASVHSKTAKTLAKTVNCEVTNNWKDVIERDDIDAVVVSTPPNLHAQISIAAMKNGKHVLCEKPLTRTLKEAEEMIKASQKYDVTLKCGFNHRFHPAIQQAWEWVQKGVIGKLNYIHGRYGICGRPGYDKEWRCNPKIVGGGHLMEQGIHLIDLSRWFLGEFSEVAGYTATYFWDMKPLEDNAFALLHTKQGQIASIHSSTTQWKNLFTFEITGQDGYIVVNGLGGSYGNEQVSLLKRDFYKPFENKVIQYRGSDNSWYEEWKDFVTAIKENRQPLGTGQDGLEAIKLVLAIYESAEKKCKVLIK